MLSLKKKPKVFVIGLNKTGTTSLKIALKEFGYKIGDQKQGEKLIADYQNRHFKKILKYVNSAEAFQDIPFSLPFTFMFLDQKFPDSKFILSVRDSAEEWYNSITKFHAKFLSLPYVPPKYTDLREAKYVYKGWLWEAQKALFQTEETDPYRKSRLIECYNRHIDNVIDYFKVKDNLLVLNLKEENALHKLTTFLDVQSDLKEIPWENKT